MKGHGVSIGFLDFALNLVCILLALFILANYTPPKKQDASVTPKAEFLITLEWDNGSPDDLDLYIRQPDGRVVFFGNRQSPIAFLDIDNTGSNSNTVTMPDGSTVQVPTRVETITVRGIMPGVWQANVHFYRKSSPAGFVDHAKIRVLKINPYAVVTETAADFDTEAQERTLANFTVEPDGRVSSVFLSPSKLVGAPRS